MKRSRAWGHRLPAPLMLVPILVLILVPILVAVGSGCIGGRFQTGDPAAELDRPTRALIDRLAAERGARGQPTPTLVPELRPPAVRAALAAARGDLPLKAAAHQAALRAVTELGRHVWSFAAECTDVDRFRPPPMALQQRALLLGAAVVPGSGGHGVVVLVVAEPGASALRADSMGGGTGGSNPTLESYAHPSVASGACGESWPAVQQPL